MKNKNLSSKVRKTACIQDLLIQEENLGEQQREVFVMKNLIP